MIHIDGVSLPQRAWFRNSQSFSCGTYTFFHNVCGTGIRHFRRNDPNIEESILS